MPVPGRKAESIDYRALAAGLEAGDTVCKDVFDGVCRSLCTGAANLVHAYAPEVLVFSGGASRMDGLRTAIQAHLDRYCWTTWGHVRVVAAENPEASVALGLSSLFEQR